MERKIKYCEFNMDTNCVEVKFSDGSMLAIDCEAVEDVYDIGVFERSELDWLIYNNPLEYDYPGCLQTQTNLAPQAAP